MSEPRLVAKNENRLIKHFQKVNTDILVRYMEMAGKSKAEVADELFVSPSAVHGWMEAGQMPANVALAIETLERRLGKDRGSVYVATVPPSRVEAFDAFCKTLAIDLAKVKIPA